VPANGEKRYERALIKNSAPNGERSPRPVTKSEDSAQNRERSPPAVTKSGNSATKGNAHLVRALKRRQYPERGKKRLLHF
jgi:hypothetical protein